MWATSGSAAKTCHPHTLSFHHKPRGEDRQADRHTEEIPALKFCLHIQTKPMRAEKILIPGALKSGLGSSFDASLGDCGQEKSSKSKVFLAIRFLASTLDPTSQYIYDYHLSITPWASSVGVLWPASSLTSQWTLAFLKNTVIQAL